MFRNFLFFFAILLIGISCSTGKESSSLVYTDYRIQKHGKTDSSVNKMLEPYATTLDASMNKVIGFSLINLNKTAADGGWPVSKSVTMGIKDKKAINIRIGGKPLDENRTYVIANSDYIANGGDNCEMLKKIPSVNKGYLVRDALIEFVTDITIQGKALYYSIENRVGNVN